jgi:D-glycero-beta-D-manno-heptose-7-phosphate kinase
MGSYLMSKEIINRFKDKKIAVVGDYCVDFFLEGEAFGVSPEIAALRILIDKTVSNPGMTGNIAAGICALGASCIAFGVIGKDDSSKELTSMFNKVNVNTKGLIFQENRITPSFTRVMAGGKKYPSQTIVRYDKENEHTISKETTKKVLESLFNSIEELDAIIVADYDETGKGLIDEDFAYKIVSLAKKKNLFVMGDSRIGFGKLKNFSCIKPNIHEANLLYQELFKKRYENKDNLANSIISTLKLDSLLLTQDKDGLDIYNNDKSFHFPAYAKKIVDVTGVGDSVTVAFTLSIASKASFLEAAKIASCAAAIAVAKPGVSTVSFKELENFIVESEIKHD